MGQRFGNGRSCFYLRQYRKWKSLNVSILTISYVMSFVLKCDGKSLRSGSVIRGMKRKVGKSKTDRHHSEVIVFVIANRNAIWVVQISPKIDNFDQNLYALI